MKIYKKLYSIKSSLLTIPSEIALFIPLSIVQFIKASIDFKVLSILMSLILYGGLALSIRVGRKEALEEIKNGTYEPLLDIEEMLRNVKLFISNINRLKDSIKKEVIKMQDIYKRPSLYIKTSK